MLILLFLYLDVIDDAVMHLSLVWKVTTHRSNSLMVSDIIVYTNWLLGFDLVFKCWYILFMNLSHLITKLFLYVKS